MKLFHLVPADWRAYLSAVREHADKRIVFSFIAILALGLMEGGGLIILLPMLQTVGIESSSLTGSPSGIMGKIQEYGSQFSFVGLLGIFLSLIIAHRLSTIRHADQIAVLSEGQIVQSGTWDKLAANESGTFAQMISTAAI